MNWWLSCDHFISSLLQILHIYAVNTVLDSLKPPIDAKRESEFTDIASLKQWLLQFQQSSHAINSTLSLSSSHPQAEQARLVQII